MDRILPWYIGAGGNLRAWLTMALFNGLTLAIYTAFVTAAALLVWWVLP